MDGTYWNHFISKVVVESRDLEVHLVLRQINLMFYTNLKLPKLQFPFDPEIIKEGVNTGDADLCLWLGELARYTGFGDCHQMVAFYAIIRTNVHSHN